MYRVLIDTWWNVNLASEESRLKRLGVLIDTWWNVNSILTIWWHIQKGF